MSDYTCEVCGGKGGSGIRFPSCNTCNGTGQKQITISLEEYDRLLARNLPKELLSRIKDTVSDINKYDDDSYTPPWDDDENGICEGWLRDVLKHAGNIAVGVIEDAEGLQEYIAIFKQEYDRLKLVEKQRDYALEVIRQVAESGISDCPIRQGDCSEIGCLECLQQAVLNYDKEDEK